MARPDDPSGPCAEEPLRMEALRAHTGYHLRRASAVVQADLATTLRPHGLRMITYSALSVIVENPGLSQTRLADALEIERPNLVAIVDELEAADLIQRERVPTDRRTQALVPMPAGRALLKRADAEVRAHEARLLDGLGADKIETVKAAMRAILHNARREET